ncbi:MAG: hypothetical protein AB1631_24495, partial [Acidobacteriota bacterium]
ADNVFREYPIGAVQIWWNYTDESPNQARLGGEVQYPTAQLDFEIDYRKNKSIQVWFVALGHNRSRSKLGYIPDETKETWLTASLTATAPTASVNATGSFAVNDYCFIENEIVKVLSTTANSLTFVNDGVNRTPQFNTTAIAHPSGTEVTVAKLSYPVLTLALTAPRFTYPTVTGFVARQRNEGVRFGWNDPSADNQEKFYLYWSTDSDALSNAAKLGSATPAWYTADPNTPGTGVNLVKTDALSHKVLQEAIGAAGTTVAARVAARNGKHNFSAALSASASNKLGDDAVPSLASAPEALWTSNGLRIKCPLPTLNMNTFSKIEVVIRAEDSVPTVLGYLSDSGGAYSNSATEFKLDFATDKKHTLNIKKKKFKTLFSGVVNLKIYFYVTNAVGSSTASPIATLAISSMENDNAADDDAAPSSLPTPKLKFRPRGLVGSFDMSAVVDNKQILFVEWHVDDGTNSLNLDDPDSFASVAGTSAWYVRGREASITIPVSARQLQKIFGSGKTITLKYRITNAQGGPTTSAASTGIALDTLGDFNDKKGVVPLNKNGNMTKDRTDQGGTSSQLGHWEKCDTSHNRPSAGGNIIDTASSNIEWDKSGKRLRFEESTPTRYLFYDLGKILIPGQYLSMYLIAQVDTGTPTPTFKLRIMADVDTDADGVGNTRVADHDNEVVLSTLQLSTTYKEIGMSIKLKDDAFANQGANTTVGHWIVLEVSGGGASIVRITNISITDGLTPAPSIRAIKFDKESFDVTPTVGNGPTGFAIPPSGEYPSPEGAAQL